MENKIWFHADDYGVTVKQSEKILSCHKEGMLNSVSVLANTNALGDSLKLLNEIDPEKNKIRRVLHLNFMEGTPLAGAENVPLLVDSVGLFDKSFIQFFQWNYTKMGVHRRRLIEQIKAEIRAQLRAVTIEYNYEITAVDSHQHYHMIPIVFDSLMEVLSEQEFKQLCIRQIRIPVDPLTPILRNPKMRKGVPMINWVKWCILRIYAGRTKRLLQKKRIESPVFFGIFYTCEMKTEVVKALLPAYKAYADNRHVQLELMFHPGNLMKDSELLDARSKELAMFYMSDNRFREAECLKLLRHDSALTM